MWLGARAHCYDIPNQKPLEINHEKVAHPPPTDFDYPPYDLKFVKAFIKHNNTLQLHTQMPFDVSNLLLIKYSVNLSVQFGLFKLDISNFHNLTHPSFALLKKHYRIQNENFDFILVCHPSRPVCT